MNNKLKRLFVLCLVVLIILIIATSCNKKDITRNDDVGLNQSQSNVSDIHKLDNFNYNNLTEAQKEYIKNMYDNVIFSENGVEIYNQNSSLSNTITSSWPKNSIANLIPEPKYGNLDRIEYSDKFINIYINEAKKGDAKDYLIELKKYEFTENERKNDGNVMLQYNIEDKIGNKVKITYMKENKTLEIQARKIK